MTKKQEKEEKVKTTHERHHLKCQLTQEELLERGDQLAHTLDELNKLADEKKALGEELKAKEAKAQAEITVLQQLVRNKYDRQLVDCNLVINYTTQKASLVRLDTEETIEERDITEEEKQLDMGFDSDQQEEVASPHILK